MDINNLNQQNYDNINNIRFDLINIIEILKKLKIDLTPDIINFKEKYIDSLQRENNDLLSKIKEILNVVEDQYGSPTNAEDLALATIKIIENKSYIWKHGEVFHYSNEGQCSWYEFAKQIFELLNFNNIKVVPVSSKEFKTKAVRPKYSLLDKSKIKTKFNIKIDKWEKSLEKMLNNPNYL